jgi:hypothetical protein
MRLVSILFSSLALLSVGSIRLRGQTIFEDSFIAGIAGWHHSGTIYNTGANAVFADTAGDRSTLHRSGSIPAEALGLRIEFDLLNALSSSIPFGTSADALCGTVYLGQTAFGENIDAGEFERGIALFDLLPAGIFNLAPGAFLTESPKGPAWTRLIWDVPIAPYQEVTAAFEFTDGNGITGDSTAAIDNIIVRVLPVPADEFFFAAPPSSDVVRVGWCTQSGIRYQVQTSDDLSVWQDQGLPTFLGDGRIFLYEVPALRRQFFRLVQLPDLSPSPARSPGGEPSPASGHTRGAALLTVKESGSGARDVLWSTVPGFSYILQGAALPGGPWTNLTRRASGTGFAQRDRLVAGSLPFLRLSVNPESAMP